jgi:hypothetical protein
MSKSSSRRFPVTVTHLPVTRCQVCHRTVAYRPGTLTEVLTEHYRRAHPQALEVGSPPPGPARSSSLPVIAPSWAVALRCLVILLQGEAP